jgi:hypothetical protein
MIKQQYSVEKLKEKFKLEHSDELFGITNEIPQQCPRINLFIEDINTIKHHLDRLEELVNDEDNVERNKRLIKRELDVIVKYIRETKDSFEELRTACETLRSWGTGWKHLARNLFVKVPNNKTFLEEKFKKLT